MNKKQLLKALATTALAVALTQKKKPTVRKNPNQEKLFDEAEIYEY